MGPHQLPLSPCLRVSCPLPASRCCLSSSLESVGFLSPRHSAARWVLEIEVSSRPAASCKLLAASCFSAQGSPLSDPPCILGFDLIEGEHWFVPHHAKKTRGSSHLAVPIWARC